MTVLLRGLLLLGPLLVTAWGTLALVYRGPAPPGLAYALAGSYALASLVALLGVAPRWRGVAVWTALLAILLVWWDRIEPRNDRDWAPEVARAPRGELDGDRLTIHGVRHFDYRSETDFTPSYEDRTWDLGKLRGLDLAMSYWAGPEIAHTILSWDFEDAPPLAVSIETRKERGEDYSAIQGFFKQYELVYVVADERDLLRLRTNHRGEHVYLYRLATPPDRARALLLDYVTRMNTLADEPAFYDALTQNCTTTIRTHVQHLGMAAAWDWRLLANGYADAMLYELGVLDQALPFPVLKAASLIDARAKDADRDPAFSLRIRDGLPTPARPVAAAPAS